jgi:hypothetical protein
VASASLKHLAEACTTGLISSHCWDSGDDQNFAKIGLTIPFLFNENTGESWPSKTAGL